MPNYLLSNNAISTLAAPITTGATTLTVNSGDGAKFPSGATANMPFPLVVRAATYPVPASYEIMLCTNRASDVLTVVRAQEGTSAFAFNAGDVVGLDLTAGVVQSLTTSISSVANLRLVSGQTSGQIVTLAGYSTQGDGGGGPFYWGAYATDNGVTVITPTGQASGAWYRIYNGGLRAAWAGAKGDGSNDSSAIIAAINALPANGGAIIFEDGKSYAMNMVIKKTNVTFLADSAVNTFNILAATQITAYDTNSYAIAIGDGSTTVKGFRSDGIVYEGDGNSATLGIHINGASSITFSNGHARGFSTECVGIDSSSTENSSFIFFDKFAISAKSVANAIGLRATYGNTYVTAVYLNQSPVSAGNASAAHGISSTGVRIILTDSYVTCFNGAGISLTDSGAIYGVLEGYGVSIDGGGSPNVIVYLNSVASTSTNGLSTYLQGTFNVNGLIQFNDAVTATPAFGGIAMDKSQMASPELIGSVHFVDSSGTIAAKAGAPPPYPIIYNAGGNMWIQTGASQYIKLGTNGTLQLSGKLSQIGGNTLITTPVSGTVYQNTTGFSIFITLPVTMNPTSGAAAAVAVAIGSTNTPSTVFTESLPAGVALDGTVRNLTIPVPYNWYYSVTVTNATIGTPYVLYGV